MFLIGTDHDGQGSTHDSQSQEGKLNSSSECHTESTLTLSNTTHGDLHQTCSPDDQLTMEEAVVPNCSPLTPFPPSSNHDPTNPTSDKSDITMVPADPNSSSAGKDADRPSRPLTQPETAVEGTWWDYIAWRSTAAASLDAPFPAVSGSSDLNTDSGVGKNNAADKHDTNQEPVNSASEFVAQFQTRSDCVAASSYDQSQNTPGGVGEMADDDHVTQEIGGKGTARTTAVSQNLFPPCSGTLDSSTTEASLNPSLDPGMGGPCAPSLAQQNAENRERGKQDQGQDQLHVGGAWYNPLSWYGSSYGASDGGERVLVDLPPGERSEKPVQIQNDEKCGGVEMAVDTDTVIRPVAGDSGIEQLLGETETQIIAADSSVSMSSSITGTLEINPIAATIDTHRSSWLSFFASRASRTLVMKSITGPSADSPTQNSSTAELDGNGMEVMDISDEGVPPASLPVPVPMKAPKDKEIKTSSSPVPPSQSLVATLVRGRGRVRGSPPRTEQDAGSDTSSINSVGQKSGAVTPGMEINGPAGPATSPGPEQDTLSTSGSLSSSPTRTTSLVKRASLTLASSNNKANGSNGMADPPKPASPTPSSKSKKMVTPPPPPNLILPAWQDTFNTAPRNVIPRPETSALTKTVQYVSGILSGARSGNWSIRGIGQGHGDKGKRRASSVEREQERCDSFLPFFLFAMDT